MTNLDEALSAQPAHESEATRVVRALLALIEQHGDHVLWRVRIRALWGLVRPSVAIRVRHCRPLVTWLAARAGVPLPDALEAELVPEPR